MTDKLKLNAAGELDAYAWPGGYPILYLDRDNAILCPKCATESMGLDDDDRMKAWAGDIYYEGPTIYCDECNAEIESAYGDPDENDGDPDENEVTK